MAIKRYFAIKDNTITNAFRSDLVTRGTGSNMGQSDTLEVFSIYGQANSSSAELERFLIEFSTDEIKTDRTAGNIPASGSLQFFLKLCNIRNPFTLPRDYTLEISAVSASWQEGLGLDMRLTGLKDLVLFRGTRLVVTIMHLQSFLLRFPLVMKT